MVLDAPNMEFLFGLDMLRKHQVTSLCFQFFSIVLKISECRFCLAVHNWFERECFESWWRRGFSTIFARLILYCLSILFIWELITADWFFLDCLTYLCGSSEIFGFSSDQPCFGISEKDIPSRFLDEERFAKEASSSGAQVRYILFPFAFTNRSLQDSAYPDGVFYCAIHVCYLCLDSFVHIGSPTICLIYNLMHHFKEQNV